MMCMTTKKKFDVEDPEVVVLNNGRFAYRAICPWPGKNDRELVAYKFCSQAAYERSVSRKTEATAETEAAPETEEAIEDAAAAA